MLEGVLVFAVCSASAWAGLRLFDLWWRPLGVRPRVGWTLSYSSDGPCATVSRIMPWGEAKDFLACRAPGERHPGYPNILASTGSRITGAFPGGRWLRWFPPLLAEVTTTYRPSEDGLAPEFVNSPRTSGSRQEWDHYMRLAESPHDSWVG